MFSKNKNIDAMLVATFLTTCFYSATYPFIHKEIMESVSDTIVAANQIVNCLSVVFFGFVWNKLSNKLFRFYPVFCVAETALGILSTLWAITSHNIMSYYIIDTLIFSIVTRNIICGGVKLRAMRYPSEEKRERFDNNNNSASAIATIIGSLVAILLDLSFDAMLCIATFGNAIDNIFYLFIYFSESKKRLGRIA